MSVQTIPAIDEMTASEKVELMEALWKNMTTKQENFDPPEWHRNVLEDRERALADGEIEFMDWDVAKAYIRQKTTDRPK